MAKIFIGTSGWVYKEWGKLFFPEDLPASKHLSYLASRFNSVEINGTFYSLQPLSAFEKWRRSTPKDFRFSVKVSRFITHIKRMKRVRIPWKRFLRTTVGLKAKRGPFLLQFPSSFTGKEEEVSRLEKFFSEAKRDGRLKFAVEFRHQNCFGEGMLKVVKKFKVALVFANSSKYPAAPWIAPASFVYFRLHGPARMFASSYSGEDLKLWALRVRKYLRQGKDAYVYFNNDMHANAANNALLLQSLLKKN